MFFDIGKKIMQYVKIVCVIGIICTMMMMVFDIVSITSMSYTQKVALYGSSDNTVAILSSIFSHLLIAAGIYVGSWVLYAFGQLVDDVHAMRHTQRMQEQREQNFMYKQTIQTNVKKQSSMTANPTSLSNKQEKPTVAKAILHEEILTVNTEEKRAEISVEERNAEDKQVVLPKKPYIPNDRPNWICEKCGTKNQGSLLVCKKCLTHI